MDFLMFVAPFLLVAVLIESLRRWVRRTNDQTISSRPVSDEHRKSCELKPSSSSQLDASVFLLPKRPPKPPEW